MGNSADTDRAQTLAAYGNLASTGSRLASAGRQDTGDAAAYYRALLSGDSTAIARATAPVNNLISGQAAEERKAIGEGGNRTGGTNAETQGLNEKASGAMADETLKAQGGAAAPLANIGAGETSGGLSATSTLGSLSSQNRVQSQKIHDDAVKQWGDVASSLLLGV
jgi:hypothetical protein